MNISLKSGIVLGISLFVITLVGCGGGGGGGNAVQSVSGPIAPTTNQEFQVTGLDYIRASSLPQTVVAMGIVAGAMVRQAPTTTAGIKAALRKSSGRFPAGSVRVTRDGQGVYVLEATNYQGETDYDPTDGQGRQTIRIHYLGADATSQIAPDAQTRRVELTYTGSTDYGLVKYQSTSGTYQLTLPTGTTNWLTASGYVMSGTEEGTFTALSRSFHYLSRADITISSQDGAILAGEVNDTLTEGGTVYSARHVIHGSSCNSTYQADGRQAVETNSAALLPDRKITFSWSSAQSLTGQSGYLTYPFSGRAITYLKTQNDRINEFFPFGPLNGDYGQSVYAKVFQHACTSDTFVKELAEFITAQGSKISDPIIYSADLVTSGVKYVEDSSTYFANEYVALPAVGLYFGQGDCEDRAILLGALLHRLQLDVVLVLLNNTQGNSGHACVGVVIPPEVEATLPAGRVYWNFQGKHYYYLEATGPNYLGVPNGVLDNQSLAAIIPPDPNQGTLTAAVRALLCVKR